jgi:pimeloyl-ACP methyl ester carboxylesterase
MRAGPWHDANVLVRDGIRQEVRYVQSDGCEVFVAGYSSLSASPTARLVVCGGWGFEWLLFRDCEQLLAKRMAERGGTGTTFDYPGHGDSGGDPSDATLDVIARAALDVVGATQGERPERLVLAGLRFGATIAVLAARSLEPAAVVLLEPELDAEQHLEEFRRRSKRANLGDPESDGLAFGVPLSEQLLSSARGSGAVVDAALSALRCPVAVVRHAETLGSADVSHGADEILVPGAMRLRGRDTLPELVDAALGWVVGTMEPT